MPKANKSYFAILGMLSIGPMSGYDIRQVMQKNTSLFWAESDGQLYPALNKLTALGYISQKIDKNAIREKKVYQITKQGKAILKKWLAETPETHIVRSELMLKLFLGANLDPKINIEHIRIHQYQTKAVLAELLESKASFEKNHVDSPHFPYWQMTMDFGIRLAKLKIQWSGDVIKKLTKMSCT